MRARSAEFPRARERWAGDPPAAPELYERIESPGVETTLGDTDAEVFTFSGRPDSIVLSARTNGALVTLVDELNRNTHPISILAGTTIETHVRARRVIARNLVGGSNAALSVHGKWAARRDPE